MHSKFKLKYESLSIDFFLTSVLFFCLFLFTFSIFLLRLSTLHLRPPSIAHPKRLFNIMQSLGVILALARANTST